MNDDNEWGWIDTAVLFAVLALIMVVISVAR